MENTLIKRTRLYAIAVWRFCEKVPRNREYDSYVRQLLRCSSSVGANYRASQRAKSTADFVNKLKIVEEEADESLYFLELLKEFSPNFSVEINVLHKEGSEILSIIVASIKTVRKRQERR